jgi:hypothetical protein
MVSAPASGRTRATTKAPAAPTLTELVARAIAVGKARHLFLSDWRHSHPSLSGWLEACRELAGLQDPVELLALRERVEADTPRLFALCRRVALGWARSYAVDQLPPIDRPGVAPDFENAERENPAWTERVMNRITSAQASAVAGLLAAEMGRGWGWAEHVDEGRLRLESWSKELQRLQMRIDASPIAWADLAEGVDGRVLVAGVPLLPAENLAARAADAGTLMPVLLRAA